MAFDENIYNNTIIKRLFWLLTATSGVVIIEPSLYEVLFVIAISTAVIQRKLIFNYFAILGIFLLFIFLIINLFSMFNISAPIIGVSYFIITFYLIMTWVLFVGSISYYGESLINILLSGYIFAATYTAIFGIVGYFQFGPLAVNFTKFGRAVALFKDPNVFGPFLIPVILIVLLKIVSSKKSRKTLWTILFSLLVIAVLISFSRAAWINLIVSFIVLIIILSFKFKNKNIYLYKKIFSIIILILTGVFGVFLLIVNNADLKKFFEERMQIQGYDSDRFLVQENAASLGISKVFGIGTGQSEVVFNYATHSLYVRILVENGFLGLLIFMTFIFISIYKSFKIYYKTNNVIYAIVAASLIGILVNSITIDSLHWRHFWLLLALPWVSTKVFTERGKNE